MDKYSKENLRELINKSSIAETERLKPFLIEAFSMLPKEVVDRCIKNIIFLEMDRWGEYLPDDYEPLLKQKVIRISKETLTLKPKIAKFIFLHEMGHAESHHPFTANRQERERQDAEADKFAKQYFPEWVRYFVRDENNNLKLTNFVESQRL